MRQTLYLDNSVVSNVTARPVRDVASERRRRVTRAWWDGAAARYEFVVSEVVVDEAKGGDREAARERLKTIEGFRRLPLTPEAEQLADALIDAGKIPRGARDDARHIAVATVHGIKILATWNFAHMANPWTRVQIASALEKRGYDEPPRIRTLDELIAEEGAASRGADRVREAGWRYEESEALRLTLFVETTAVTYLTDELDPDPDLAWRQEVTRDWWAGRAGKYDLIASRDILDEARKGSPEAVRMRLEALEAATLLDPTAESEELADGLLDFGAVPLRAKDAATHFALAATQGACHLLTWDILYLMQLEVEHYIWPFFWDRGYQPSLVNTPYHVMGEDYWMTPLIAEARAAKKAVADRYINDPQAAREESRRLMEELRREGFHFPIMTLAESQAIAAWHREEREAKRRARQREARAAKRRALV